MDEDSTTGQKTRQVCSFGKRDVFRLHLNESREGFCRRGRGRSFHVEKAREPTKPVTTKTVFNIAHFDAKPTSCYKLKLPIWLPDIWRPCKHGSKVVYREVPLQNKHGSKVVYREVPLQNKHGSKVVCREVPLQNKHGSKVVCREVPLQNKHGSKVVYREVPLQNKHGSKVVYREVPLQNKHGSKVVCREVPLQNKHGSKVVYREVPLQNKHGSKVVYREVPLQNKHGSKVVCREVPLQNNRRKFTKTPCVHNQLLGWNPEHSVGLTFLHCTLLFFRVFFCVFFCSCLFLCTRRLHGEGDIRPVEPASK